MALFLVALTAVAVACLCCCLERVDPKKERIAVAWLDKPILKHLGGGGSSPVVSEMISEKKVRVLLYVLVRRRCPAGRTYTPWRVYVAPVVGVGATRSTSKVYKQGAGGLGVRLVVAWWS